VREREREAERQARAEARRYLLDARKEIDRTLRELRATADLAAVEEQAKEARRKVEGLAARQNDQLERLHREERNAQRRDRAPAGANGGGTAAPAPIGVNDMVEVATLGGKLGRVLELRDADAVVAIGTIKLTVPVRTLARSNQQAARAQIVVPLMGDQPEVFASTEVDLRGMRVDEVDDVLLQAVDSAVRADLRSLRVIHGKGTGALRERVTELLRKDTRVKGFRLGAWNEGGAGVTVLDLE
jgi:DNA mismatch repair protein MutS2